jgi:membrane protein
MLLQGNGVVKAERVHDASALSQRARRASARVRATGRLIGLAAWRGLLGLWSSSDPTHAAAISYYSLLSLFPFFLLVLSVIGAAVADEGARQRVLEFVLQYFPAQFDFVREQIDAFTRTRLQIGIGGGLALIWASLGVFGAISTAVNAAWRVERQRSFVKHKMFSFLMLAAAGGMLMAAVFVVSAVQVVDTSWFEALAAQAPALRALETLAWRLSAPVLLILVCGLIFYFVPNARVRFVDVWPGAILTGLLEQAALQGFSWVVRDMSRFTVHGSIAAVVLFLLWVYVSAVILLYGVEFTAAFARMRRRRPEEIPATPAPRQ